MKVVIKKPNSPAFVAEIPRSESRDSIRSLIDKSNPWICTAVRGCGMLNGNDIVCYCDDEGLLKNLPLNFYRPTDQSPIVGTVVAVKIDANTEDNLEMTDAEANSVAIMLDTWSRYSDNLDKEIN